MKFVKFYFLIYLLESIAIIDAKGQESANGVVPFMETQVEHFPNVRDVAISGDGNEVYFTAQSYLGELSAIVTFQKAGGKWSPPQVASFSGCYMDMEPFMTPDGLRLYFVSNRPIHPDSTMHKDFDIWMVVRESVKSKWSQPLNLGPQVNSTENEFYPSVAESGNLYFTKDGKGSIGKDDIFISKRVDGTFQTPQNLSDSVNSAGYEFNAMIAPDESWLLLTCYNRAGGYGSGDLYICYKDGNGIWSSPINLGKEINSPQMDYCPFVDLKSGELYFTSKRTSVKDHFETIQSMDKLLEEMQKYDNGLSRLYRVKSDNFDKWIPSKK